MTNRLLQVYHSGELITMMSWYQRCHVVEVEKIIWKRQHKSTWLNQLAPTSSILTRWTEVTIDFNQQPSFQLIPDIFLQVKTHLADVFSGSATFMDTFDYENHVWASMQPPHMAKFDYLFSQESIDDTKKSPEKTSSRGKLTKSGPNIGTPVVLAKFISPREVPCLVR